MTGSNVCKRCGREVVVNADNLELFEGMHWICFHFEFEHQGDPDEACKDASCPWWQIAALEERLRVLGVDPEKVIDDAIKKLWKG
jgi:hypothetical protein